MKKAARIAQVGKFLGTGMVKGRAGPLGPPTERASAEMASAAERSGGVSRGGCPTGAEANIGRSGPSPFAKASKANKHKSAETSAKAGGPAVPHEARPGGPFLRRDRILSNPPSAVALRVQPAGPAGPPYPTKAIGHGR